jgi:hypothetical protein
MRPLSDPGPRGLDRGRASIEFLVFSVVLLVPIIFGVQSLWAIQGASIGAEQAARDAVRAFTQSTGTSQARTAADTVARRVTAEHGVAGPIRIDYRCQATSCLAPGSLVEVRVTTDVSVFQAPFWGSTWPVTVSVTGTATARVSRYGGVG